MFFIVPFILGLAAVSLTLKFIGGALKADIPQPKRRH